MIDGIVFDVQAALSPLRRAIGLRRLALWLPRGVAGGAIIGASILGVHHFFSFADALVLAAAAVVVGAAAAVVIALVRWPSIVDAARVADRAFALDDRITTALEFQDSREPLAVLQRRDVRRRVAGLQLADGACLAFGGRELGVIGAALVLFIAAMQLPSAAQSTAHAQPANAALNAVRNTALSHLQSVRRAYTASLAPNQRTSTTAKHALATFSNLARQLRKARTQAEALRQISAAQTRLSRLGQVSRPVSAANRAALVKAMHHFLTKQENAQAKLGGTHADHAASHLLNRLAQSTKSQPQSQRQQTSRALQRAASSVNDSKLRSDLSKAASSLGHNDTKTASQALRHAARLFHNNPSTKSMHRSLDHARKSLDSVKNDVNKLRRKTPRPETSAGQSAPPNRRTHGTGHLGKSQGISGHGSTKRGQGPTRAGQGPASAAKDAAKGGVGGAGNATAHTKALVYVPGQAGKGQHLLPVALHAQAKHVPVVPYQRVIARYGRSARASLDRSPLPPSLRSYVRSYFTALSKQ